MQIFFSFYRTKNFIFLCLFSTLLLSCEKEVDFSKLNTEEPLNNGQGQVYEDWEVVNTDGQGLTSFGEIESDGEYIYFDAIQNGVHKVFLLDTTGTITELFVSGASQPMTAMKYIDTFIYAACNGTNIGTIKVFNSNGLDHDFDFNLTSANSRINTIEDYGSEIIIGGIWQSSKIKRMNKTTGSFYPMGTLYGEVFGIDNVDNEIYATGRGISSNSYARPIVKWNGTDWEFIGGDYEIEGAPQEIPTLYSATSLNNELAFSGYFNTNVPIGRLYTGFNGFIHSVQIWVGLTHYSDQTVPLGVVRFESTDHGTYLYGSVDYSNSDLTSCFFFNGYIWKGLGKIDGIIRDIAVHGEYIYAITYNQKIYRHKRLV